TSIVLGMCAPVMWGLRNVALVDEKHNLATRLSLGGWLTRNADDNAPKRLESGTSRSSTTAEPSMRSRIGTVLPSQDVLRLVRARKMNRRFSSKHVAISA